MKNIKLLIGCVLVGILVALLYFAFEQSVHHATEYIWNTLFQSDTVRWLVVPLCLTLGGIFFGLQHLLDRRSEEHESHGLGGEAMQPTLRTLGIILLIGFFSLVAGASLGPEAVLVPACMVAGAYVGVKLLKDNKQAPKALAAAAIVALFTAFFHSFFVGVLAVLLVSKQAKVKLTPALVLVAIIASASSTLVLNAIDPTHTYCAFPALTWGIAVTDLLLGAGLVVAGFGATFALKFAHDSFLRFRTRLALRWWQLALVAGSGLALLYLLGGTLVQFTGNQSIVPLLDQAPTLGFVGLMWIFIVKVLVIAWSKSMGYRGGLVFPMIFVGSVLIALAQLIDARLGYGIGIVAVLVGMLMAEKRAKILF